MQKTFPFIDQNQIDNSIQEMITSFRRIALDLSRSSLSLLQSIFSVITQIIIIPLVAFFILKDGPTLKRKMANLVPNKYFEMVLYLLYKTDIQIGNFVRGQIVVNMILAVFYSVGFYFLDIPFYIVLGVFSGLANIIPYIGPIIGITPPIIVAVMESAGSFALIPWIVVLFAVIQIVDNTLLQPTIVARSVDLHPLIIIFAVLTGGQLLGLAGMLFSVLLAGIIKVVIVEASWSFQNYNLGRTYKRREDTVFIAK